MRLSRHSAAGAAIGQDATRAPALRASFPDVAELRIELEFDPESGWSPSRQVHVLRPAAQLLLRYPCPFPGCTGRFQLEAPITELLRSVAGSLAGDVSCTGVRPRAGNSNTPCTVRMHYRVQARYASAAPEHKL